jgi:hypothetical protein
MPSLESREFWVIFDTCTRAEYYRDAHNLLALPKGAVMRYEYRDIYLSDRALRLALNDTSAPSKILLVYAQKPGFPKAGGDAQAVAPVGELEWVATRFGAMKAIPSNDGANFFFDFSVEGYPKVDLSALRRILAPMIARSETPFHKWVAISDDFAAYSDLDRGEEEANWEAIVDRMCAENMQFRADSFWRLKPNNAVAAHPALFPEVEAVGGAQKVRQVTAVYGLHADDVCSFEAISYGPEGRPSTQLSRSLRVDLDPDGPLVLDGSATMDLRQYTARVFNLRVWEAERESTRVVKFETPRDQNGWPVGPEFELSVRVSPHAAAPAPGVVPKTADAAGPVAVEPPPVQPGPPKTGADAKHKPAGDQPERNGADDDSSPKSPTPWFVLQEAMKKVRFVRFALAAAGFAAAAAIALSFFKSFGIAVIGTAVILVFAILLFALNSLEKKSKLLVGPALVLAWVVTLLFAGTLGLTVSTVFFGFPMTYAKLAQQFQSAKRAAVTVAVKDQSNQAPIAGARVTLPHSEGRAMGFTTAAGKVTFQEIPTGEGSLLAEVSAPGYQKASVGVDTADPNATNEINLTKLPDVLAPPPQPGKPTGKKSTPPSHTPTPAPTVPAAPTIKGTWLVYAKGDINNLRMRDGTFDFAVQRDGEILVNANFVLDKLPVKISGSATAVGSMVSVEFQAKSEAGGDWSGRGTLTTESPTQMSGSIQPKSGANVPLILIKVQ